MRETRVPVADACAARRLDETPGAVRRDEHLAARRQHDAVAGRGEVRGGEPFPGIANPLLARLIEVGVEVDRDHRVLAGGDVEQAKVRAELIDDPPAGERGILHVPLGVPRVLPEIAALGRHRPDVHEAVAIRHEVDASPPEHRIAVGARVVAGEAAGLRAASRIEAPDVLRGAALVSLRMTSLEREPHEEDGAAVVGPRRLGGLAQRHALAPSAFEIDEDRLEIGETGLAPGDVDETPIRREAFGRAAAAVERPSPRKAAVRRHRIDLVRAFVLRREGDRGPIRREDRVRLHSRVARETRRETPGGGNRPEVPFRDEDHPLSVNRGMAVVADGAGRGSAGRDQDEKRQKKCALHGFLPRSRDGGGGGRSRTDDTAGARPAPAPVRAANPAFLDVAIEPRSGADYDGARSNPR